MATTKTANTAIRLGITGDPEVKRRLDEIGQSGDAAAQRMAKSFVKAESEVEAAIQRRERQMAKLNAIMPQTAMQMRVDERAGTGFGEYEGSARRSASVFAAMIAEQEQMEQRARALRAAIDPLWAAQERFNGAIGEARGLVSAGVLSLDEYVAVLRREQAALDAVNAEHGRATGAVKGSGMAFASAAPQIQDFIVQASMGGNVMQALVVQGGQLAGQLIYVEGKVGNVARALMGPWGIAAQVALMVLAPFVAKLFEGGDAAEDLAKKIAKEARETEASRLAQVAYSNTLEGRIDKQRKLNDELSRTILTERQVQEQKVGEQLGNLAGLYGDRDATRRALTAAITARDEARGAMTERTGRGRLNTAEAEVARLERLVGNLDQKIEEAQRGVRTARIPLLEAQVAAGSNEARAAEARYQTALGDLRKQQVEGRITESEYQTRLAAAQQTRDQAIAKAQEATRLARDAETLTANQVAKMLRGELPGVRVTSTTSGKHVKNSYHYRNQAVDFVPAGGMGSMTKDDVRRIFEARGIEIVELLGPGDKGHNDHFHVAWTKGKLSLDAFTDAAKRAKEEMEVLDKLRLGTLGIDNIRAVEGALEALARQTEETRAKARAVLGIDGDPLAGTLDAANDNQRRDVDAWNAENARRVDQQRADLQDLSGLYATLFTGGTKGVWQTFKQMGLQVLAELLARWTLFGSIKGAFGSDQSTDGGLLGTLVGLFGGKRGYAAGTHYSSAGAALVGENGPELVNLPRGSRVTPAGETRRLLAGNDNRPHFTFAPVIDARGAGPREVEALERRLDEMEAEFPQRAVAAWQDARQRRMIG